MWRHDNHYSRDQHPGGAAKKVKLICDGSMKMKIVVLIAIVLLSGACASMEGGAKSSSFMPTTAQLEATNPYLLNCPAKTTPVCDIEGGRVRQVGTNCRCVRF